MNAAEAAERTGYTLQTIQTAISRRQLAAIRHQGRKGGAEIAEVDLARWVEGQAKKREAHPWHVRSRGTWNARASG